MCWLKVSWAGMESCALSISSLCHSQDLIVFFCVCYLMSPSLSNLVFGSFQHSFYTHWFWFRELIQRTNKKTKTPDIFVFEKPRSTRKPMIEIRMQNIKKFNKYAELGGKNTHDLDLDNLEIRRLQEEGSIKKRAIEKAHVLKENPSWHFQEGLLYFFCWSFKDNSRYNYFCKETLILYRKGSRVCEHDRGFEANLFYERGGKSLQKL